jgi:hypothetical protein
MPNIQHQRCLSADLKHGAGRSFQLPRPRVQQQRAACGDEAQGAVADLLGPRIRQTLQIAKNVAQWYSGYDQLLNPALDLFNDAYYDPKMVVVPVILSMQEI